VPGFWLFLRLRFLVDVHLLELWLQWLDDEEQAANTDDSLNVILALYDLAVADYLCIKAFLKREIDI